MISYGYIINRNKNRENRRYRKKRRGIYVPTKGFVPAQLTEELGSRNILTKNLYQRLFHKTIKNGVSALDINSL